MGTQVLLARSLGPATYGIYAIGWTLLRLGTLVAPLGLDRAILRFGSSRDTQNSAELKGTFVDSFTMATLAALAFTATVFLLSDRLAAELYHQLSLAPVLRWLSLALLCATGLRVLVSTTWTSRTVRYGILTEDLGQPGLNLLLVGLSTYVGWGLGGAVRAAVWSFAIPAVAAMYIVAKRYRWLFDPRTPIRHARVRLLQFSIPAMIAASLPVLLTWMDRIVVGAIRPAEDMGIYQAVSQLPIVFSLILSGIGGSILGPMVADLHQRGERARVQHLFLITTKWGLYVSIPIFLIFVVFSSDVIVLLYGRSYLAGRTALVALASAGFVNAASGPVGLTLIMTGRERAWLLISGTALALDAVLQVVLTSRLGLPGAGLATLLSMTFVFGAGLIVARRLGYWPYDARFRKGALAGALALAVAGMAFVLVPLQSPLLRLLIGGGGTVGVYVGALFLQGLDDEDRAFIRGLAGRRGYEQHALGEAS